jgi:hypothetical protein
MFYTEKRVAPSITISSINDFVFASVTTSASIRPTSYQFALSTSPISTNLFFGGTWGAYVPASLILIDAALIEISAEL